MRWFLLVPSLLLLIHAGCDRRPDGAAAPASAGKPVPKETVQYMNYLVEQTAPWLWGRSAERDRLTAAERRACQHIYRLQEQMFGPGGVIREKSEADRFLELTITVPAKFTCGEDLPVKATLKNLTGGKLAFQVWENPFSADLLSAEGLPIHSHFLAVPEARAAMPPRRPRTIELEAGRTLDFQPDLGIPWRLVPPGRWHLRVACTFAADWLDKEKFTEGLNLTVPVELAVADRLGELACSLEIDPAGAQGGQKFILRARLKNVSKDRAVTVLKNRRTGQEFFAPAGVFDLLNTTTGRTSEIPIFSFGDEPQLADGYPAHYLRAGDFASLAPGEEIVSECPALELDKHFQPGEALEVRWKYANKMSWFLTADGQVGFAPGTVWVGGIATPPVTIRKPAASSAPAPATAGHAPPR